jgi:hypothetical protein
MPGSGKAVEREYSSDEEACKAQAMLLGARTYDVFLNDDVYWKNVPDEIWGFTIGGYQVLKKWLSYRVESIIGRPLTLADVNYFRDTARRLAALRLLTRELDSNYRSSAEGSYPWRIVTLT